MHESLSNFEVAHILEDEDEDDGFPKLLWAEMVNTAVYILNRTGVSSVDKKSPHELWLGKKPRIKHLRIIGMTCYVHVPDQKRRKLDKKALKYVLIGYDGDDNYRVWNQGSNSVLRSRDVRFEQEKLLSSRGITEIPVTMEPLSVSDSDDENVQQSSRNADKNDSGSRKIEDTSDSEDEVSSEDVPQNSQLRDQIKYEDYVMNAEKVFKLEYEPDTYGEAIHN